VWPHRHGDTCHTRNRPLPNDTNILKKQVSSCTPRFEEIRDTVHARISATRDLETTWARRNPNLRASRQLKAPRRAPSFKTPGRSGRCTYSRPPWIFKRGEGGGKSKNGRLPLLQGLTTILPSLENSVLQPFGGMGCRMLECMSCETDSARTWL